jgi:C-terminal processing protease CtpA/Prc
MKMRCSPIYPAFRFSIRVACCGAALAIASCSRQLPGTLTPKQCVEDFDYLWTQMKDNYAYFDRKSTEWNRVREVYRAKAATINDRDKFITLLESLVSELYDAHIFLSAYTSHSPRPVPIGSDLYAEWRGERAVITELRKGFSAEQAGLQVGMEIISINGVPINNAVTERLDKMLRGGDDAARNWALQVVLAGYRDQRRSIEVASLNGVKSAFQLDLPTHTTVDAPPVRPPVEWRLVAGNLGYVRINNLGSTISVSEFDAALERLKATHGLVVDLREIPNGGGTSIAEPIMGRLIGARLPYQKVIPVREPSWMVKVSPRGEWTYRAPVVVLVGRWSASMAEGIAIGLDAMNRGTVVGTPMAKLNGGILKATLPNSKIEVGYPGYRLCHVDGTPREDFVPPVLVRLTSNGPDDPVLEEGVRTLKRAIDLHPYQSPVIRTPLTPIADREPEVTAHLHAMFQDAIAGTLRSEDFSPDEWQRLSPVKQKELQAGLRTFGDFVSLALVERRRDDAEDCYRYRVEFKKATLLYRCSFDRHGKMTDGEFEETEPRRNER